MAVLESNESACVLPPVATRWQSREVAQTYDRQRFTSFLGRLFNYLSRRALSQALTSIQNELDTVLDLPCGTGRATEIVRQFTSRVTGADISPAMIAEAARRLGSSGRPAFVSANVTQQPFPDNAFSCITSIRFMMHLDDTTRRAALREMARVASRYVVVEYGYTTGWLRLRRAMKRRMLTLFGKKTSFVRAVPWESIRTDIDQADLVLHRAYPTARGLSESIILVLKKR
jgi:ubiquinone/menaquinone biosynthesis C-methylase UbiE